MKTEYLFFIGAVIFLRFPIFAYDTRYQSPHIPPSIPRQYYYNQGYYYQPPPVPINPVQYQQFKNNYFPQSVNNNPSFPKIPEAPPPPPTPYINPQDTSGTGQNKETPAEKNLTILERMNNKLNRIMKIFSEGIIFFIVPPGVIILSYLLIKAKQPYRPVNYMRYPVKSQVQAKSPIAAPVPRYFSSPKITIPLEMQLVKDFTERICFAISKTKLVYSKYPSRTWLKIIIDRLQETKENAPLLLKDGKEMKLSYWLKVEWEITKWGTEFEEILTAVEDLEIFHKNNCSAFKKNNPDI